MQKILVQQGDCIIRACGEIPEEAKRVKLQGNVFVVLKGEGVNTHELQSQTLEADCEIYQKEDTLYLKIKNDVPLVHQEHGTNILRGGLLGEIIIEREFDYERMEARNTQD